MKRISIIALLALAGCTSTYVEYDTPNGSKLSVHRRNCLSRAEMPSVKFNVDGSVELIGYKNDGGQDAIGRIVEASVKGAVQGVTK